LLNILNVKGQTPLLPWEKGLGDEVFLTFFNHPLVY